jgi:hypothetical protein
VLELWARDPRNRYVMKGEGVVVMAVKQNLHHMELPLSAVAKSLFKRNVCCTDIYCIAFQQNQQCSLFQLFLPIAEACKSRT